MLVPAYLPPYVLSGTVVIIAAVLFGLHRALKRARWPDRDRRHAVQSVAALLVGWYLATLVLAWFEFYRGAASRVPTIQRPSCAGCCHPPRSFCPLHSFCQFYLRTRPSQTR